MQVHIVPTPYYGANAAVVISPVPADTEARPTALVVDPSGGVADTLTTIIDEAGADLVAVLVTHGHPDHVWEVTRLARHGAIAASRPSGQVPVWIPGPDRYRMDDPASHVAGVPEQLGLGEWEKPADLYDMPAGSVELVPGLWMKMVPAPGHTEGSSIFIAHSPLEVYINGQLATSSDVPVPWSFTGDVIFAGSVGRTDLPGGDEIQMRHSLRTISNAIDPQTILFPGHGPATTLEDELRANPYVARARRSG